MSGDRGRPQRKRRACTRLDLADINMMIMGISSDDEDYQIESSKDSSEFSDSAESSTSHEQAAASNAAQANPSANEELCGICLQNKSTTENPLLKCGNCRVRVHRECYGSSTQADSSWLCDPCRFGQPNPWCELCPDNRSGIYKRTNSNRFVHVICAVFHQHITRAELCELDEVQLDTTQTSSYKRPACQYCEDAEMAVTGARLGCEAGVCKVAYHATCGFRRGLCELPDAKNADPETVCEKHADSAAAKARQNLVRAVEQDRMKSVGLRRSFDRFLRQPNLGSKAANPPHPLRINRIRPLMESILFMRINGARARDCNQDQANSDDGFESDDDEDRVYPAINDQYHNYFQEREHKISKMKTTLERGLSTMAILMAEEEMDLKECKLKMKQAEQAKSSATVLSLCCKKLDVEITKTSELDYTLKRRGAIEELEFVPRKILKKMLDRCPICKRADMQIFAKECASCGKRYHRQCLVPPPQDAAESGGKGFEWLCPKCFDSRRGEARVGKEDDADDCSCSPSSSSSQFLSDEVVSQASADLTTERDF